MSTESPHRPPADRDAGPPPSAGEARRLAEEIAGACVCVRLRQASRLVTRAYDQALRPLDLKTTQVTMLAAVAIADGHLTLTEIAERLGMDRSTFSRNLGPLERRGLVELSPERRHRARTVGLTADGRRLLAAATPLWRRSQAELRETVGEDQLLALLQQLRALASDAA